MAAALSLMLAMAFARPTTVGTPWPVELPCPRPQTLWAQAPWGNALTWSGDDGAETQVFTLSGDKREVRLPRAFQAGQLKRLTSRAPDGDPSNNHFAVHCGNGGDVMWGPCPGGACAVTVSYPGEALPMAKQGTRRWTDEIPGSPYEDTAPDAHWTRFHRDIARKPKGDAAAIRESLRFSRAYAIELRDLLTGACRGRRCSSPAREASAKLAAYLADRSPSYGQPSARAVDHWTFEWAWTATGGGVPLAVSCDDMLESRNLLCNLRIELTDGDQLVYATFGREVDLYAAGDDKRAKSLGHIHYDESDHKPATAIDGRLLELRPATLPAN